MGNEASIASAAEQNATTRPTGRGNPDIIVYDESNNEHSDTETWEERVRKKTTQRQALENSGNQSTRIVPKRSSLETKRQQMESEDTKNKGEEIVPDYSQNPKLLHLLYGDSVELKKEDIVEEDEPSTRNGEEVILHKVNPTDSLLKLSVKYNVTPAEIKKANKLWTNEDIFGRKELVIPISHEQYLLQQTRTPLTLDTITPEKKKLVHKFMEITQCGEEYAFQFLVDKKWNFLQAVTVYYSQDGAGANFETNLKEEVVDSKSLKEETDEIWLDNQITPPKAEGKSIIASYLNSGDESGVGRVGKSIKDRFMRQEEEIFEI
jgi:LysM repeat protein